MTVRTVFTGGIVVDGTGRPPSRADVAIEGDRIVEVGSDLKGDEVRDIAGRALVPGCIDVHVHLAMSSLDGTARLRDPFSLHFYEAAANARRLLEGGVTTARDAGGADAGLKAAIDRGLVQGPKLVLAVNMISQTGGHNDGHTASGVDVELFRTHDGVPRAVADGVSEVRRVARTLIRAGAGVLKVAASGGVLSPSDSPRHRQFAPDELAAIVDEARAVEIDVMAHAQGRDGIAAALDAGVRSIEHGIYLDDELIQRMIEEDVFLVPTLSAPIAVVEAAALNIVDAATADKARGVVEAHRASVRAAIAAGVRVVMGTDSGIAVHGHNLRELELLGQAGMSPWQAWAAATSEAATLLRAEDRIGSIVPGLTADLVVLDGDPADLSRLPQRVMQTWQDGSLRFNRTDTPQWQNR